MYSTHDHHGDSAEARLDAQVPWRGSQQQRLPQSQSSPRVTSQWHRNRGRTLQNAGLTHEQGRTRAPGDAAGALAHGARADQVQRDRHALALGLDRIQAPQVHLQGDPPDSTSEFKGKTAPLTFVVVLGPPAQSVAYRCGGILCGITEGLI